MSIVTERRRLADVGLVMREREDWGAVFDYTNSRPVNIADLLVGHIAVVDDPGDLLGTEDQVMRNIERIGMQRFPATGYSYNGAAFNTGRLYEGQPLERRGAHTVNDRRRSSCTMAGCPSRGDSLTAPSWNNNVNARALVAPQMPGDPCTDKQVVSFARWGAALKLARFATADARWHGHRCFAAKDCPGNEVWLRLDDVADLTADYVRAGHVGDAPTPDPIPTEDTEMFISKYGRSQWVLVHDRVYMISEWDFNQLKAGDNPLPVKQLTNAQIDILIRRLNNRPIPHVTGKGVDYTTPSSSPDSLAASTNFYAVLAHRAAAAAEAKAGAALAAVSQLDGVDGDELARKVAAEVERISAADVVAEIGEQLVGDDAP